MRKSSQVKMRYYPLMNREQSGGRTNSPLRKKTDMFSPL